MFDQIIMKNMDDLAGDQIPTRTTHSLDTIIIWNSLVKPSVNDSLHNPEVHCLNIVESVQSIINHTHRCVNMYGHDLGAYHPDLAETHKQSMFKW